MIHLSTIHIQISPIKSPFKINHVKSHTPPSVKSLINVSRYKYVFPFCSNISYRPIFVFVFVAKASKFDRVRPKITTMSLIMRVPHSRKQVIVCSTSTSLSQFHANPMHANTHMHPHTSYTYVQTHRLIRIYLILRTVINWLMVYHVHTTSTINNNATSLFCVWCTSDYFDAKSETVKSPLSWNLAKSCYLDLFRKRLLVFPSTKWTFEKYWI